LDRWSHRWSRAAMPEPPRIRATIGEAGDPAMPTSMGDQEFGTALFARRGVVVASGGGNQLWSDGVGRGERYLLRQVVNLLQDLVRARFKVDRANLDGRVTIADPVRT
jgi:hypothetical protein